MKNLRLTNILTILVALLPILASCSKEEIVFDHELQQFPTLEGHYLLEVIVPSSTSADDQLYIVGPFNGGVENAVGNPMWQLEKVPDMNIKYGIYLDPATFVDGKTLADGYYFYSERQREERTLTNGEMIHTESPELGGWMNVTVNRWAAYYDVVEDPSEVEHDGCSLYVLNNSSWDDLYLYAWGDEEVFGGWPGIKSQGTVTIAGVKYSYFDFGEANKGKSENLIINNGVGGAGGQFDVVSTTLQEDIFIELTNDGFSVIDPSATITHDGNTLFVYDASGWDTLCLYAWGDEEVFGAWPGIPATGTVTINGLKYAYFDFGEANKGKNENLIINNGAGGAGGQYDVISTTLEEDVYIELNTSGFSIIDPQTFSPEAAGRPAIR